MEILSFGICQRSSPSGSASRGLMPQDLRLVLMARCSPRFHKMDISSHSGTSHLGGNSEILVDARQPTIVQNGAGAKGLRLVRTDEGWHQQQGENLLYGISPNPGCAEPATLLVVILRARSGMSGEATRHTRRRVSSTLVRSCVAIPKTKKAIIRPLPGSG